MNLVTAAIVQVATIRFIGIAMFTLPSAAVPAITSGTGVPEYFVVMPYIPSHIAIKSPDRKLEETARSSQHLTTSDAPASSAAQVTQANQHIEHHVALLIFKETDLLDVTGWEVKRLEANFLMIQLNGEHVSFVSDGQNSMVNTPIALGHIGGRLRPEYLAPNYSDAAAVFDIPTGKLAACSKDPLIPTNNSLIPLIVDPKSRIDTELTLNNSGQLTIQAGRKSLTVRGDAIVLAANTPLPYAKGDHTPTSSAPHYMAYCAMVTDLEKCNPAIPQQSLAVRKLASSSASNPLGNSVSVAPPILQCEDKTMVRIGQTSRVPTIPYSIQYITDFACSDSQWP